MLAWPRPASSCADPRFTLRTFGAYRQGYGGTSQRSSCAYREDPDISAALFRPEWTPSANSSIIFLLKAGISSGLREVTSPLSTTTSWSTHCAPALRRSVASDGQDVIRRPFTAPASISVHGAWQ